MHDADTGLIYMHHRYYDPQLGHFLNPDFRAPDIYDPTTFTEPYAYAAGNPMMFWDADGLAKVELINRNILISDRLKEGTSFEKINEELKGFGFREIGIIERGLHIIAGAGASVAEATVGTVNTLSNATFGAISYYHYSSTGSEVTKAHADRAVNTVGTLVDSVRTGTIKTSIINSGADKLDRIVKAHENGNYAQLSKEVTDIGLVVVESIQGGRSLAKGITKGLDNATGKVRVKNPCPCFAENTAVSTPDGSKLIQEVSLGSRVLTKEFRSDQKSGDYYADQLWLKVIIQVDSDTTIEALRSADWVAENRISKGASVIFEFSGKGAFQGKVVDIEPFSSFEVGPGKVVLSKISMLDRKTWALKISSQESPILTTLDHKFYSLDRQKWVKLRDLNNDEKLLIRNGSCRVEGVTWFGYSPVFDLEVADDHNYYVSESSVLVHNCNEILKPVHQEITERASQVIQKEMKYIKELDPSAIIGIRGSAVKGTKGPHKGYKPFDPTDFDLDLFIVSEEIADLFPSWKKTRRPEVNQDLLDLGFDDFQKRIAEELVKDPLFDGLRDKKVDFRIVREHENEILLREIIEEVEEAAEVQVYILPLGGQ